MLGNADISILFMARQFEWAEKTSFVLNIIMHPILNLSTLESHLWEAANILRGSPVDRTDWKSYILPLMFFKRICDVWDEEYQEAVETYGEDFADEHRFQIPEGCHWQAVRETPTNVGTALQNAMRCIEVANQKHLYGVFGDSQWTNKDRLPDALLKDLIEHFSAISLGNRNVTTDIIGDGYEYLIKKFADATNKKAGEFYTPRSVVRQLVDILDPQENETIYDPACGAPRGAIKQYPKRKEAIRKVSSMPQYC
jgi:type I restriction enzyme M protein